jgi:hypothetical protein
LGEAVSLREEEALGGMVGFFEARVEAGGTHTAKMTGKLTSWAHMAACRRTMSRCFGSRAARVGSA